MVADLDNDRDADVMVIKSEPPHDVFLNNRVWAYQRDGGAARLSAAPLAAAMAADLDADGESEIYALGQGGLERWRREGGGDWRSERLAPATAGAGARLAIADTNGDGRLEVLALPMNLGRCTRSPQESPPMAWPPRVADSRRLAAGRSRTSIRVAGRRSWA